MQESFVLNLEQIFQQRMLQVPDYQRGYAWEKQQWTDLLDDLELLPSGKEHYTGTLVLHLVQNHKDIRDEKDGSYSLYDIVDGQQRITTLTILLDAIRRELSKDPKKRTMAEGLRERFLWVNDENGLPMYRLRLHNTLQDFFVRVVLADDPAAMPATTLSQSRLLNARNFFADYLKKKLQELAASYVPFLVELQNKISRQLKLSLYPVSNAAEVGVVFEVMNNRGKPLSELEKVKNYLLYVSTKLDIPGDTLRDEVNKSWAAIFTNLASADLGGEYEDRLLRAHWLISQDYNIKEWHQTRSIKDKFSLRSYQGKHLELLRELLQYTQSLGDASLAYRDINKPDHSESFRDIADKNVRADIAEWSEKLRRLDAIGTLLPLLLAGRLRTAAQGNEYLSLVKTCEAFVFRVYKLHEYRSHTGRSSRLRLAFELYQKKQNIHVTISQLQGILVYYSNPTDFSARLRLQGHWYYWSAIRYFLFEYEKERSGRNTMQITWDKIKNEPSKTIEHILPQTATDPYWTNLFNKQQHEQLVHSLGNLCLTENNESLSNKSFPQKCGQAGTPRSYATSLLRSEQELAQYKNWTPQTIQDRHDKLAAWAEKRWGVAAPTTQPEIPEEELSSEETESDNV